MVSTPFFHNRIQIDILDQTVMALIDTGAAISCMSPDLYQELNLEKEFPLQPSEILNVHGVGSHFIPVKGQVSIPLTLSNKHIFHPFAVLERMTIPLLIGMDFINKNNVVLDFVKQELVLSDHTSLINYPTLPSDTTSTHSVQTTSVVQLPPQSEMVLSLQCNNTDFMYGLVEPRSFFAEVWNVLPARSVVKVLEGKVTWKILNPTNMTITLVPHVVVAYL